MTHRVASTFWGRWRRRQDRQRGQSFVSHSMIGAGADGRGDGPVDELAVRAGRVLVAEGGAVAVVGGVAVAVERLGVAEAAVEGEAALDVGHLGLDGKGRMGLGRGKCARDGEASRWWFDGRRDCVHGVGQERQGKGVSSPGLYAAARRERHLCCARALAAAAFLPGGGGAGAAEASCPGDPVRTPLTSFPSPLGRRTTCPRRHETHPPTAACSGRRARQAAAAAP
jgi:hypothetical protein